MRDALNDAENLIVPKELQKEFDSNKIAFANWENFPRSSKKAILKWISEAKRDETRTNSVTETVKAAIENRRIK